MSRKLRLAYDFIRDRLAQAGLSELDISHGDIMYQLFAYGSLSMNELAARIGRDKSTVTALVRKMEELGLVRRRRNLTDSRVIEVELTPKGASYETEFIEISNEVIKRIYRGFTEKEKRDLINLLSRLGEF